MFSLLVQTNAIFSFRFLGISISVGFNIGQLSRLSRNQTGPDYHTEFSRNSLGLMPRNKISAGLSYDGTWCHWCLSVSCSIVDTRLNTNIFKEFAGRLSHDKTIVLFVQKYDLKILTVRELITLERSWTPSKAQHNSNRGSVTVFIGATRV